MAKAQVKLHFIELGIPAKIQYARDRVKDMDGNPYFPEPDIELKKITEATDDLEKKYLAAQGGGPAQTALQNEAEALWDDLLRKTAGYVSRIADGNVVVITSAGFTPTDIEPSPAAVPSKPQPMAGNPCSGRTGSEKNIFPCQFFHFAQNPAWRTGERNPLLCVEVCRKCRRQRSRQRPDFYCGSVEHSEREDTSSALAGVFFQS